MAQSTDGGNNWDSFNLLPYPSDMKSYGEYLFISSLSSGVYILNTNSTTPMNISVNIPNSLSIFAMDINAELIVAGGLNLNTSENQIWTRKTSDITSIEKNDYTPNRFDLYQNYPNPFNPNTKIQYSIPDVGASLMKPVQLKVYDVLGKEVATLVNEYKPSGNYEVNFNASGLTSGIYFYQITAGNFKETKKMILMK